MWLLSARQGPLVGRITVNRLFHLAVLLVPRSFDSSTKPLEFLRARKFEVVSVHRYFYRRRSISQPRSSSSRINGTYEITEPHFYEDRRSPKNRMERRFISCSFVSSFAFYSSLNLFPLIVIESVHELHEGVRSVHVRSFLYENLTILR